MRVEPGSEQAVTAARPRVVAGLRLVAVVGRGAEGEVWEARDPRGRRRALKLIRPDSLVDPDEVQRRGAWLVEVEHPALARVWRTGVLRGGGLDGWGFVEMSFVDGRSMHRLPALPDALERLGTLAEGLDLLHAGTWSQGVPLVHRDVKPANLIETPEGGLVLVDHSTLRAVTAGTVTRIGTPVFAAPEVVSGRIGPPADVYSFCATAVALLTGARGDALAGLLADPWRIEAPDGVRAGLATRAGDRPPSCRATLDADGFSAPGMPTEVLPAAPAPGRTGTAPAPATGPGTAPLPPSGPDAVEAGAWQGPRPAGGWLAVLALLVTTPPALAWLGLPLWPESAVVLGAAAAVHLACHAVRGRHVAAALVLPPLAWALLLAERSAPPGRRRDWALPLLLGALAAVTVPVVLALRVLAERLRGPGTGVLAGVPGADVPAEGIVAAAVVALALLAVSVRVARRGRVVSRLLLAPVWASGAALVLAGGVLLLLPALFAGRAWSVLRLLGRTLAGAAGVVRPERRRSAAPGPVPATAGGGWDSRHPHLRA